MKRILQFFAALAGGLLLAYLILHYSFAILDYFFIKEERIVRGLSELVPARSLLVNLVFVHILLYSLFYRISQYLYWESGVILFLALLLMTTINFGSTYFSLDDRADGVPCLDGVASATDIDAFYFSVVTFTTLGYGDVRPLNICRIYAMAEAVVGLIFFPYFLAFLITHETRNRPQLRWPGRKPAAPE